MAAKGNTFIAIVLLAVAGLLILFNIQSFFKISNFEWIVAFVNIVIAIYLLSK